MKNVLAVSTTAFLWSSVAGFGLTDPSVMHSLHEVTNTLSQVPSAFPMHSEIISSAASGAGSGTSLLDMYKESLATNPLTTKMITGGTLAVCGDAIAQSRSDDEYDKKRAASFAMFDMAYRAVQHFSFPPIVQACQGQYIGTIVATLPGFTALMQNLGLENPTYYYGAMEQTLASQLGIVPFFYYPVFYTVTALVQGLDKDAAVKRAQDTFIPLMKRNLLFWIPVQFVQFGYIDENLQIPFLSVCGLMWTVIISLFAGNAKKAVEEAEEEGDNLVVEMNHDSTGITTTDIKALEKEIIKAAEKDISSKNNATVFMR